MKNANKKRLFLSILILIIIIVTVILVVKSLVNDEATNSDPIHQNDTQSVYEFVDESGNKMDEASLQAAKDAVVQAFKAVPAEKLGITVDLSAARIVFNQGITTISGTECFVFNVYSQEGEALKNIGTYAMSRDTLTLYRFNSESLEYDLIVL